ncbi:MAG: TM0106 family RecB-like putative nuclease [Deltaproteobacteria bacterium]|nr:TM0106 family RecB-like putative nuclease [Deltaproteobacteria bacterium]
MRLRALLDRATAGQRIHGRSRLRPSLVDKVLRDPFWVWCQHHAPKAEAVNEIGRYEQMRYRRGVEHEDAWVAAHYPGVLAIRPDFGHQALVRTLRAMLEGVPAIHQPQLWDLGRDVYGRGDLLVRDDSHASDLGPYHYRVIEIKRARKLRDAYVLQAAFYNRTVGAVQGYMPERVTVALREEVRPVDVSGFGKRMDDVAARWCALRDRTVEEPEPGRPPDVTDSPWRAYGNRLVHERRDLVLLAGVRAPERAKLRAAGIHNVDELWTSSLGETEEILGPHHGATAYHVAQSYRTGQPVPKPGRELRIPRARRLLYFDFETSDDTHPTMPPHVYLIGCWDGSRDQFVRFLARGPEDEAEIFEEFLDYVGDDLEAVRLYHWTDYEVWQMKAVMRRWPRLEGRLARLMGSCVDLKRCIQDAVYLPVPRFSIKSVAPALGFNWRQQGFGAYEALLCYWDAVDTGDRSLAEKAVRYNEDDCVAMWHVDQRLTGGA